MLNFGPGCTIAHLDSEMGFSGGEVQVFLLLEGLRARGIRNVLFCQPGSRCAEEALARGIEVQTIAMRNYGDLRAVWRLRRGLRAVGAVLVHANTGRDTWLGAWAARGLGLPVVSTRRMDRRVKRGLRTRLLYGGLVRRVVAISPGVATCLAEGGIPDALVALIPEAVDPARIRAARSREVVRAELGVEPEELFLLGLGALHTRKGWDVLLDALALLAREGLHPATRIAGAGPERAALEARAAQLGLADTVRWLGARADSGDLLGACDVVAMPSRREGLGVASLEAMGAGRPIVASRVGGLGFAVVNDETGLLVPPEEPASLADALARLGKDSALRARLGAGGQARVQHEFLPERMVERYAALYHTLLQPNPMAAEPKRAE